MATEASRLARSCRVLLASRNIEHLWTDHGPTAEAEQLVDLDGKPLAPSERILVLATWALWSGSGAVTLAEIVEGLEIDVAELLCSLVIAIKRGPRHLAIWLEIHDMERRS